MCCDSDGDLKGRTVLLFRTAPLLTLAVFSDELVQAGWEKCWSKRENRPYYFNRFTNQSLWEMPVLGQHDVIVSKPSSLRGVCQYWDILQGQMPCGLQIAHVEGLLYLQNCSLSPSSDLVLMKYSSFRCTLR